jgi:hypothetical protein
MNSMMILAFERVGVKQEPAGNNAFLSVLCGRSQRSLR